ncbi:hypothetical protein Desti_4851 [Desulfomonile tiedjei DSM 6799]|uniref:Uncharacterized protein n=1 Tax=Desulfomonile tiedjei (strain ATCC 49306 / DSM 6799 / DCB-1) TaxID=706587 RepID=I4CD24_DESTA|nr:hypothetical protein Desti_4851 [Desulfomonile tiedjei DSM 6799]
MFRCSFIAVGVAENSDVYPMLQDKILVGTGVPASRECLKSRNFSQIVARSSHHLHGLIVGAPLVGAR